MYVVVNTTQGPMWTTGCYIMPGEEPRTFDTLEEAAEVVRDLMCEHQHTLESAKVYELQEVPLARVRPFVLDAINDELADLHPEDLDARTELLKVRRALENGR